MSAAKILAICIAAGLLTAFSIVPATPQASRPECKEAASTPIDPSAPSWNGWSPSGDNSRFQPAAAAGLSAETVKALKLKWAFNLGGILYFA